MKDFDMSKQSQEAGGPSKDIAYIFECKKILKNKILQLSSFHGFDKERANMLQLIQGAVQHGQSNSALIIGPSGSGKTTLVRSVLEELSKDRSFSKQAIVVKLNGLIHTDDRLSLKAISRQMNLENVVEDRVTGTFADNMVLLLQTLRDRGQARAVVFILEEVALFCSHHNQVLLYNLFDIAHSNQAAVCVLGLTSRIDVLDLMEKRVKSRFSHRYIYLLPRCDAAAFERRVALSLRLLQLPPKSIPGSYVTKWNQHVAALLQPEQAAYTALQLLFDVDTREQATRDFLLLVIACLDEDHPQLTPEDFTSVLTDFTADDRTRMLAGLSVLELILVIAMKHLSEIYQGEPLNFEMVHDRYLKYTRKHPNVKKTDRNVVLKAFEHLQALEVVVPVVHGSAGSRVQREYQLHHFQLIKSQVDSVVAKYEQLPEDVKQWSRDNVL